ncbi:hypothetical protein V1477_007360 [Vespula maculifrons]|uniref:Uncharacterized protein n=1 Tax=Vespula maculifrons TaxID=7453 RepID=A0ABD2CI95_VESMC
MRSGDTWLRETTTKSGLKPTFIVSDSVVLWTSTRELRYFRGCHPYKLKCEVGILGFEGRQQSRFPVQLCFGLRPVNFEIFADAIRPSINEQLIQIYNSLFDFRLKCEVGIHGFERRQQNRLCFGHRQENLDIFVDAIHTNLNAKWGYSASRDDNKVGSLTDLCSSQFSCALDFDQLKCDVGKFLHSRRTVNLSPRVDLEIFSLSRDFENLSPRVDLEIFAPLLDFENLSSRMDLEIFALAEDFENLSS